MNELYVRNDATLTDVRFKDRLIEMVVVPWDQEANVRVRGEQWREVFQRGAFDGLQDHAGRVTVNRDHNEGDSVGKAIHFDPSHTDGLFARVKIASTPRGDETLALAEEDVLGASMGYFIKQPSDVALNPQTMLRRVKRAFLRHIGMVAVPAYAGARVLAVREEQAALRAEDGEPLHTPKLYGVLNDDLVQWASTYQTRRESH